MTANCIAEGYDKELECPICLDCLNDPVEAQDCGHMFCNTCLRDTKLCPVCRKPIQGTREPNRMIRNMVNNVTVRCRNCNWVGTREQGRLHQCSSGPSPSLGHVAGSNVKNNNYGAAPYVPPQPSSGMGYPAQPQQQPSCSASPYQTSGCGYPPNVGSSAPFQTVSYGVVSPQASSSYASAPSAQPAGRRYLVVEPTGSTPWRLYGLSQEDYDQIVSLFVFFDEDDSGSLDRKEVGRLARWLNFARTPQEVNNIFAAMDADRSGSLSLGEFLSWLRDNRPNPQSLYGLTQSQYNTIMMQFHMYDTNQDGCLEQNEFTNLVLRLGDVRDAASAARLFQMIDRDHSGTIDLHEFLLFRAGQHNVRR